MDTSDEQTAPGALSGIRLLDMTSLGMGPLAAQMLGDFGADVIKVEPLTGDVFRHVMPQKSEGMSHAFIQFNRNKRSLALDLKSERGRKVFEVLLKSADVVLSNNRPDALRRLGLDYEALRLIKPDLIFCGCYGYSERGRYRGRPAADDTIQALSGLVEMQGRANAQAPMQVATVVADKAVGLVVVNSILAALFHRERTGKGQQIEVPMFETMVAFVMPEHMAGQTFDPPLGETGYLRVINPERRPYPTKDGYICVLPYTTAQWKRFFLMIGREDLAEDKELADPVKRSLRFVELFRLIREAMVNKTTDEWCDELLKNDILFGRVMKPEELFDDPHLADVGMFTQVEHKTEGKLRLIGFPMQFSETPCTLRHLPPNLGEHSRELLAELGVPLAEIDALQAAGVIATHGEGTAVPHAPPHS